MTDLPTMQGAVCPAPLPHAERIVMGHGSGGIMSHNLIQRIFQPAFDNPALRAGDDSAAVLLSNDRYAFTTDSHVVQPLFFPGGDIGRLAVCGTVNDLAMLGATPLYLTCGFVLEEGLEIALLQRVAEAMRQASLEAHVQIVAGDTKVVQKGKADGLYITTSGLGRIPDGIAIGGANARPGDLVLVSGTIGDHGIAVLAARGELGFETDLVSDVAPLNDLVSSMLAAAPPGAIHVLRDPTRGGLGTTLNEIARQSHVCITLNEMAIPFRPEVTAACEMLGFDPLYIANEGKLIAIVERDSAEAVLSAMQGSTYGAQAAFVGEVTPSPAGRVLIKTPLGATRIVDMLAGEILPRIC